MDPSIWIVSIKNYRLHGEEFRFFMEGLGLFNGSGDLEADQIFNQAGWDYTG
jgi:hypothetical protein